MKWLTGYTNTMNLEIGLSGSSSNPGTSFMSTNSGAGGGSSNGSVWNSLFGNLGGILQGAGSFVKDVKTDYNQVARDQANANANMNWAAMFGYGNQQQNGVGGNSLIWIILGALVLGAVIFFASRK